MPPLPLKYASVDVECVATSRRHDGRAPALVAIVDQHEEVVLRAAIEVPGRIVSYLTPLTGITAANHVDTKPLDQVIDMVRAKLGPDVVLVGQSLKSDIEWLKLREGVDFKDVIELSELFKAWNPRYNNYNYSSLSHATNTLLPGMFIGSAHDPAEDALASIRLAKRFYPDEQALEVAHQRLVRTRPSPSFAKQHNYQYEGVCMAAFYAAKCSCDAPSAR
eukprot:m.18833 g.18833  ORF g.18833 m.18833 type:complete len:220 (-) comp10858_c0_seq1:69-728(-)